MKLLSLPLLVILLFLSQQDPAPVQPPVEAFEIGPLTADLKESGHAWSPFLIRDDLDCGVYFLPAGSTDRQPAHRNDEVYFVHAGRARLTAGERELEVAPGSIVYVEKEVPHRFHDIAEDLTVLVFFAKGGPEKKGPEDPPAAND